MSYVPRLPEISNSITKMNKLLQPYSNKLRTHGFDISTPDVKAVNLGRFDPDIQQLANSHRAEVKSCAISKDGQSDDCDVNKGDSSFSSEESAKEIDTTGRSLQRKMFDSEPMMIADSNIVDDSRYERFCNKPSTLEKQIKQEFDKIDEKYVT